SEKSDEEKFIGTWKNTEPSYNTITFLSDGSGSSSGLLMLWEIKDGKLVITVSIAGTPHETIYDYVFSDDNQTLTLIDTYSELSYIYTKQ
ncbi:MAG: hypothetical protein BV456_09885, partial [Thermoplasmata archaeon M8B2D]